MRAASAVAALALLAGLTACGSSGPPKAGATDPASPTGNWAGANYFSDPPPILPSPTAVVEKRVVVPSAARTMPADWEEAFAVPYGPKEEELGDGAVGYGAPASDGSWWFLDIAKHRLAHYDASGAFLNAIAVPRPLQHAWDLPHVLSDGTLVAFWNVGADRSDMLRLRNGVLDEVPLSGMFTPNYDDGRQLYGTVADRPGLLSLDPATGDLKAVAAYRLPTGAVFKLTDDFGKGRVRLDGQTASVRLTGVTRSGAKTHLGMQFRAGADGSVHLFLVGYRDEEHPQVQLVGYLKVAPSGAVSHMDAMTTPYSDEDLDAPAQLVVAPGDTRAMLVYVLDDGVYVYRRTS